MADKKADLAGPGIGNYKDLEKVLPNDYEPILNHKETMKALYAVKNYIEENGPGAAYRRCQQWRERLPRPRRLTDADHLSYFERL